MSSPNCNYNLPSGEFYSKKQETYENELKQNNKKHKIYSISLYVSIVIFLISFILFIILLKKNKDIINSTINQSENQLTSAWSVSVIICLICSILSVCVGIFSGVFMIKYGKIITKYVIDDEIRPCYSQIKKEILTGMSSQQNKTTSDIPTSGVTSSIITGQTGKTSGTQNITSGTSINGTGLDQIEGIKINTQSGETTEMQEGGTRNVLNSVETGKGLKFNQAQTNQNTSGVSLSVSGNASSNPENVVSGNATSSSSNSGTVAIVS